MLYADDAGNVSESAEGLAKMMTVLVTVFEAPCLTVSETKTGTMLLLTPNQAPRNSPLVIEAAGQRYRQATRCCIWPVLSTQAPILCRYYGRDQTTGPTRMRMLQSIQAGAVRHGGCPVHSESAHAKAEVMGTLLYGCVKEHFAELRKAHHRFLLRVIGFQR